MDPVVTAGQDPERTQPIPVGGAAGGAPRGRGQRSVRNFVVDGPLQLRLASYLVAVALILSVGLGWLLWDAWRETSQVIALGAADAGEPLAQALAREDGGRLLVVAVALAGVLLCLLVAAVVVTHKIAGPAFAIARTCRQVGEGRLARPRPLRAGDLLTDLADDVAGMVDALRGREASERDAARAAAAVLRDPAATPAARADAAAALERLAQDKEDRLGA
jgi:hypothetical protein